jgi:hypothetical protein
MTTDLTEGRQERDRILDLFEQSQPEYIVRARAAAMELCQRNGSATIDEVRAIVGDPPKEPRVNGAVFSRKLFEKIGYESSNRAACHARPIARFRLRGKA